jgi:hypothetical protein
MENKLERLLELRKLQEKTETEIGQLVTELYSIIQPKKRKETANGRSNTLPKAAL